MSDGDERLERYFRFGKHFIGRVHKEQIEPLPCIDDVLQSRTGSRPLPPGSPPGSQDRRCSARSTSATCLSCSTKTQPAAPRESASSPMAPVPANRSSTDETADRPQRVEDGSRTISLVGRTVGPAGTRRRRLRRAPATIRTVPWRPAGPEARLSPGRPRRSAGRLGIARRPTHTRSNQRIFLPKRSSAASSSNGDTRRPVATARPRSSSDLLRLGARLLEQRPVAQQRRDMQIAQPRLPLPEQLAGTPGDKVGLGKREAVVGRRRRRATGPSAPHRRRRPARSRRSPAPLGPPGPAAGAAATGRTGGRRGSP